MATIMITGASRGLGLEFTRQFYHDNWKVIATCRDPGNADELNSIGDVNIYPLDVTHEKSVVSLADKLRGETIDVLINNAGIIGQREGFGNLNYDIWAEAMETNVFGPMRVAEAFKEQVLSSEKKQMIFITSRMGSITEANPNAYVYRSSKAALNMAVKCLSIELETKGLIAVLFHPGHVQTDMGGQAAPVTARMSIEGMKNQIVALTRGDNGCFLSYDGEQIPW